MSTSFFSYFPSCTPGFLRWKYAVLVQKEMQKHKWEVFPSKIKVVISPMISFFLLSGSWSIPGGGPGDPSWVLQRHRGWKGCRPILEEGHLQSDLQTGQRGSWGLQIPQLSTRAPPWLTRPREEAKQARQTSEDSEKTVGKCRQRLGVRLVGGLWWNAIEGLWRS